MSKSKRKFTIDVNLKKHLNGLDLKIEPLDDLAIAEKIKEILTTKNKVVTNKYDRAEYIAFYFYPNDSDEAQKQKRYYFPMMSGTTDTGQVVEFPDPKHVDADVLDYWKERATKSKHPILVNRYADLAVDFEQRLNNGVFDYTMAQRVIDSTIQICSQSLEGALKCKTMLRRALALANSLNDDTRIKTVQQTIIDTEKKFAEDDKPGLWGYAFDWLILDSPRVALTKKQEAGIVGDLEQRLVRLTSEANPSPWNVENAVLPLAKYYAAINNENKVEFLLKQLEESYRKNIHSNSDGLLVANYLEKLSDIYRQYGKYKFSKAAVNKITAEMSNLGERAKTGMQEISVEMPIKKEEVDQLLDSIFGKKRELKIDKVIANITITFLPRKDRAKIQLDETAKKFVFLSLGNHSLMSEDGFSIANYGSIQDDPGKHLIQQLAQDMHFWTLFLRIVIEEFKKIFSPKDIWSVLSKSPTFREKDKEYALKVLTDFWNKDYLSSSCLMIPLIEDSVRNLFRITNSPFIHKNADGGYDVDSLEKMLGTGIIKALYGNLGENIEYYFRVLLTERIGWNLRNNYAHGVNKNAFNSIDVANRLMHVLLCLSLIRKKEKTQ